MRILFIFIFILFVCKLSSQNGYGNQWIFGRFNAPDPSGAILNFFNDTLQIEPINKAMELEGSCAIMCDSTGKLLFYSNGCYIANSLHEQMSNGDSIGKGYLETSYCDTGGSPLNQAIIALPKPGNDHLYYLFYTDIDNPYSNQPYFPLAPQKLYTSLIDMSLQNGQGAVVEKNIPILLDTFARAGIQAERHINGKDWWLIMPKSHSNCYWTCLINNNGIDTIFKQCIGEVWGDRDPSGQVVFSPLGLQYVRFNYFYGLNIFDFDKSTGLFSNPLKIDFGQDTFYYAGAAFSSNSRFVYACAYNKVWQFDLEATDISMSRVLIGELNTPPDITEKTWFNQARLGPDEKIYIAGTFPHSYLHVIDHPNCLGLSSGLKQYEIKLPARNSFTMPNMPNFKQWIEHDICESVNSSQIPMPTEISIRLFPNPAKDFISFEFNCEGLGSKCSQLLIYDQLGRILVNNLIKNISDKVNIDLKYFADGIYYFQFKCLMSSTIEGKFIVKKT